MYSNLSRHWRRFRPHFRRQDNNVDQSWRERDKTQDEQHFVAREEVQYVCSTADFFDCAEQEVVGLLQRRPEMHDLDRDIERLRKRFNHSKLALEGMVALLAQAPRATLAQIQMDEHPHGYHNKQARLFELIDFNDTLVATVLLLDDLSRTGFSDRAKQACDRICKRVGAPCFTDEQWDAIIHGLTLEIAVYSVAKNNGFNVYMTSRSQDAMGIDLQVQDPETSRYINIDVKSPSSFRYRLEELLKEGRINIHDQLAADANSYAIEMTGHGRQKTEVVLLCILPDLFGDLAYFRFVDEAPMRDRLALLIRQFGLNDGRFGQF